MERLFFRIGLQIAVVCFVLLVRADKLAAQDTKLPHPFMWKSFNNPGYAGFNGLMGVNVGMQRAYWSYPLDYRSYFVSADYPFQDKKTFGLGGVSLFYQRDQEKSVMYVTSSFGAAISGRVRIARNTVLQLGLQPMLYQKNLDPSRLTLGDQFDPYYGQVLSLSPELVNFYSDNILMFDMAAGIYGQTDFALGYHGLASVEYGFSVYHIIESTQSFLSEHGSVSSEQNLLNRRYSAYLSYSHPLPLGNQINTVLTPYVMADFQSVMKNLHFGIYWEEERFGMIGLGLRSDQYEGFRVGTMLVHVGANLVRNDRTGWKIGYTCEVPTHQGTMYKNTSHSLSLHWYFKKSIRRCAGRFENSPNNTRRPQRVKQRSRTFRF